MLTIWIPLFKSVSTKCVPLITDAWFATTPTALFFSKGKYSSNCWSPLMISSYVTNIGTSFCEHAVIENKRVKNNKIGLVNVILFLNY